MSKNSRADWRIQSPLSVFKQRAFLCAEVRRFFAERQVLEVTTPVLSNHGNTDVQIDMFHTQALLPDQTAAYLRTSPEFFHKRLLASGVGDLFEIAKVFRRGERTRLHHPEFTLLEWYRLDFTLHDLMQEVVALIQHLLAAFGRPAIKVATHSYQELFETVVGIDPFAISDAALSERCQQHGYTGSALSRTEALDFLFACVIQPALSAGERFAEGVLIHRFPLAMAALAKAEPQQPDRCLRFEFLWHGVELANGYQELTDATEQRARFITDNQIRQATGKPTLPLDEHLLAALDQGLPDCAGVALGLERLLMSLLTLDDIDQVTGFIPENS